VTSKNVFPLPVSIANLGAISQVFEQTFTINKSFEYLAFFLVLERLVRPDFFFLFASYRRTIFNNSCRKSTRVFLPPPGRSSFFAKGLLSFYAFPRAACTAIQPPSRSVSASLSLFFPVNPAWTRSSLPRCFFLRSSFHHGDDSCPTAIFATHLESFFCRFRSASFRQSYVVDPFFSRVCACGSSIPRSVGNCILLFIEFGSIRDPFFHSTRRTAATGALYPLSFPSFLNRCSCV